MNAARVLSLAAVAAAFVGCRSAAPRLPAPVAIPIPAPAEIDTTAAAAAAARRDTVAPREVTRQAVKLFGDSVVTPPPPADSAPARAEPSWDIDVRSYETHAGVERWIARFTTEAREIFRGWLSRGGRYEPMIRPKLKAAGLPEDLTYLALIESGYNPHAYSRAAAVGMWQFMYTTGRGTGLRIDWWVDERRDPIRSTDAAIKFLGWLNEQFGSLYLAAAAYNGGPGRIARGLDRYADELAGTTGEDVFFALAEKDYLRAETKDYVPKLIAAALIAKEPERYGMQVQYLPPLKYDTVRVGPATPLAAVAKAVAEPLPTIRELNSSLLRGMTPPRDSFTLRVPPGKGSEFRVAYRALTDSDRTAFTTLRTKKGETLGAVAARAGVSPRQLAWYNRELKPGARGRLAAGRTVLVPSAAVLSAALDVPDPTVEHYGSARGRAVTHVVKRGESLGTIARRYRTSVASLKRLNRLKKNVIFPGQVIVVRGRATRPARSAVARQTRKKASAAPAARIVHVVRQGESLQSIARRYDTTAKALRERNGLQGNTVRVGQRLLIKS